MGMGTHNLSCIRFDFRFFTVEVQRRSVGFAFPCTKIIPHSH
jgi:hypothetical protein